MGSEDKTGKANTQTLHVARAKGSDVIHRFSFMSLSYADLKERGLSETHVCLMKTISSDVIDLLFPYITYYYLSAQRLSGLEA